MGHYFAELACPTCQATPCTCPIPLQAGPAHWVVSDTFQVHTARAFQSDNNQRGFGFLTRMTRPHFSERAHAEAYAETALSMAIAQARAKLAQLEALLPPA